jgi:hypothetical protein
MPELPIELRRLSTQQRIQESPVHFGAIRSDPSQYSLVSEPEPDHSPFGLTTEARASRVKLPTLSSPDHLKLTHAGEYDEGSKKPEFPTAEVHDLAREFARRSQTFRWSVHVHPDGRHIDNPLDPRPDGPFDPLSPKFNARKWTEAIVRQSRAPGRSAGVAFRNLSAYGTGSAGEYQKTVGNVSILGRYCDSSVQKKET